VDLPTNDKGFLHSLGELYINTLSFASVWATGPCICGSLCCDGGYGGPIERATGWKGSSIHNEGHIRTPLSFVTARATGPCICCGPVCWR
jgi:hypothetical protein